MAHLMLALVEWIASIFSFILRFIRSKPSLRAPISVNYHFTRQCNYRCGFCFHTAKTSHVESLDNIKTALRRLADAGMKKINFSGGEPFLEPKLLGEMCEFAKEEVHLESVSIVSNGSMIRKDWITKYGKYVDILAVSCDSFDEITNEKIGRGKGRHVTSVKEVARWCEEAKIKFKLNTVVNIHNWQEDMRQSIAELRPARWKVFQVLTVAGENGGGEDLRDASSFRITSEQFKVFVDRHAAAGLNPVPEDNSAMRASYLILDEELRFLDCSGGAKKPSRSILEVSVQEALKQSGWDEKMFIRRGGKYAWSRSESTTSGCSRSNKVKDIEDL